MEWIATVLHEQWGIISAAPYGFGIAVFVTGIVVWKIIDWFYKGSISGLKERLSAKDDRIAHANERREFAQELHAVAERQLADARRAEREAQTELASLREQVARIPQPPQNLIAASNRTAEAVRVMTSAQLKLATTATDILTLTEERPEPEWTGAVVFDHAMGEPQPGIFYVRQFSGGIAQGEPIRIEALSARDAAERVYGGPLLENINQTARVWYQVRSVDRRGSRRFGFSPEGEGPIIGGTFVTG